MQTILVTGGAGFIGSCFVRRAVRRGDTKIVRMICSIVDRLQPDLPHAPCESLIQYVRDRPGHNRRYAIDASEIKHELG